MNNLNFQYRDGEKHSDLYCEDVSVTELAAKFSTPLYIYSKKQILANYRSFAQAIEGTGEKNYVSYAIKANSNLEILKLLSAEGAGASVVSGGELLASLRSGFDPKKITFDGPGKTDEEILLALRSNIFAIDVESLQELHVINELAGKEDMVCGICIRVNPHVDAKTHPYISTGLSENKFGISIDDIAEVFRIAKDLPNISIVGLHSHIGSQITELSPFIEAAQSIADFIIDLRATDNIDIKHINFGGGQGISYRNSVSHPLLKQDDADSISAPSFIEFAKAAIPILATTGCTINVEPGRAIIANTCCLISKVLYTKSNGEKHFVIVDAGMNDLIRPSLYHAYHEIVPVSLTESMDSQKVDVVGPICETGDFLAHDRILPKVKRGDLVAVTCAGAYGYVLSSNYNLRPRAAEILVDGNSFRIIRERERVEDIMS